MEAKSLVKLSSSDSQETKYRRWRKTFAAALLVIGGCVCLVISGIYLLPALLAVIFFLSPAFTTLLGAIIFGAGGIMLLKDGIAKISSLSPTQASLEPSFTGSNQTKAEKIGQHFINVGALAIEITRLALFVAVLLLAAGGALSLIIYP